MTHQRRVRRPVQLDPAGERAVRRQQHGRRPEHGSRHGQATDQVDITRGNPTHDREARRAVVGPAGLDLHMPVDPVTPYRHGVGIRRGRRGRPRQHRAHPSDHGMGTVAPQRSQVHGQDGRIAQAVPDIGIVVNVDRNRSQIGEAAIRTPLRPERDVLLAAGSAWRAGVTGGLVDPQGCDQGRAPAVEAEALQLLVGGVAGDVIDRLQHGGEVDTGRFRDDRRARQGARIGQRCRRRRRQRREGEAVRRYVVGLVTPGEQLQSEWLLRLGVGAGYRGLLDDVARKLGDQVGGQVLNDVAEHEPAWRDLDPALVDVAPDRLPVRLPRGWGQLPRQDRPHQRQHRTSAPVAGRGVGDAAGIAERVGGLALAVPPDGDVVDVDGSHPRVRPAAAVVDVEPYVLEGSGGAQPAAVARCPFDQQGRLDAVATLLVGHTGKPLEGRVALLLLDGLEAEVGRGPEIVRVRCEQPAEIVPFTWYR